MLKRKERKDACGGAKDKSDVKMGISSVTRSGDLGSNLKRV